MIEILLVKDGDTVFRSPVLVGGAKPEAIEDSEVLRLSRLCSVGANPKRLKVMVQLASGKDLLFSDVMQLVTNPKLAQDCLQPLLREGLVLHGERGSTYRASTRGRALVVAISSGMGGLLEALERELGSLP